MDSLPSLEKEMTMEASCGFTKREKANKHEKTEIAERIVSIIHESHGRFLKWDKDCWVEVEYSVAREKVSHFFRHLRSKTVEASGNGNKKRGLEEKMAPGYNPDEFRPGYTLAEINGGTLTLTYKPTGEEPKIDKLLKTSEA